MSDGRENEIGAFLDPDLRHQRAEDHWLSEEFPMPLAAWCDEVYRSMQRLSDPEATSNIDRVAESLAELETRAVSFCGQIRGHITEVQLLRSALEQVETHHTLLGSRIRQLEGEHETLSARIRQLEGDHETLSARVRQLEGEHATLSSRIYQLEGEHSTLSNLVSSKEMQIQEARMTQGQLNTSLLISEGKLKDVNHELAGARQELQSIFDSRSWHITRPLRAISRMSHSLLK